jgi:hypothetical protein
VLFSLDCIGFGNIDYFYHLCLISVMIFEYRLIYIANPSTKATWATST